MGKIKEKMIEIEEALDEFNGPHKWKSCQEIADMMGVPVDWVNSIVIERGKKVGLIEIDERSE